MKTITAIALIGWLTCSSLLAGERAPAYINLFQAIRAEDRAAVGSLLKSGLDVHARDELGNTALMAAALNAAAVLDHSGCRWRIV